MTEPVRVLIVDDSAAEADRIGQALRRALGAMEFQRVENASDMRAALANEYWSVIISGGSGSNFGALAALDLLHETGRDVPLVIVSDSMAEELVVTAMRAGARDCVRLDQLARLAPVLARALRDAADREARRNAEDALRMQVARFRALVENTEDGISLTARDGTSLYMSPAADRILCDGVQTRLGRSAFEGVHPEDLPRVAAAFADLASRPGATIALECRIVRRDGGCRWIEATGKNMLDDPAVRAVIGNFRDVSERRQALEALQASEARHRRIIETTSQGVWMVDADSKTTFVNQRMAQLLASNSKELLTRTPLEFLAADARQKFHDMVRRLSTGASEQLELPFKRANGTTIWALLDASPAVDSSGRFDGALLMVMDVTARKRAEESLRVSEARFGGLWNSGLVVVSISDLTGRIREINDAGVRMVGYTREELIAGGIRWSDLTPPEWRAADDNALQLLETTGVAPPWEKQLFRKDGERVPILTGAALLDANERITIGIDLTVRKRAETALRTSEDQLRQSQKMDAIGRLAGGVAHDFNNVLSVILTLSELAVADTKPGERIRADLDEIRRAGWRAADLTRQLLMFSRQQVFEPKVFDVCGLLTNMEKMLRPMVGERVEVVSRCAPGLALVRADPSSIEQVVMNLVVNARDAMPTGGKLTLETANVVLDEAYASSHHGVSAGPHVMLAVSDTGIGMDAATVARMFEPFFTTKEHGKGTGLGLSTVFGIVKQSDGSIAVDTEPGRGTTVRVYFPRVDGEPDAPHSAAVADAPRGTETVLLVEDEDQVRAVARTILRRRGYKVLEASDAATALIRAERHDGAIDLLLTDVVMPHMSGPELALKLMEARPQLRVLCMSGYTDDHVARDTVHCAKFGFLQKPITPDALSRKVREVLDGPPILRDAPR